MNWMEQRHPAAVSTQSLSPPLQTLSDDFVTVFSAWVLLSDTYDRLQWSLQNIKKRQILALGVSE